MLLALSDVVVRQASHADEEGRSLGSISGLADNEISSCSCVSSQISTVFSTYSLISWFDSVLQTQQ